MSVLLRKAAVGAPRTSLHVPEIVLAVVVDSPSRTADPGHRPELEMVRADRLLQFKANLELGVVEPERLIRGPIALPETASTHAVPEISGVDDVPLRT